MIECGCIIRVMSVEYIKKRGQHHCFHRSEYMKSDKNEDWNLFEINEFYHHCVHHGSTDEELRIGKEQDEKCKRLALIRYGDGPHLKELEEIMFNRKYDQRPRNKHRQI